MRTICVWVCLLLYGYAFAVDPTTQQTFTEAQRAYLAGDLRTAKEKLRLVLAMEPNHQSARSYLRMIAAQEAKAGTGGELQQQLKSLVLPKVELRDATFGAALDYLKQLAKKQTDGKIDPSFVVQLPDYFVKTKTVTLNLNNIPFTEALRYLGELAQVKFAVEKHAVVVKELSNSSSPSSAP